LARSEGTGEGCSLSVSMLLQYERRQHLTPLAREQVRLTGMLAVVNLKP